MEIQHKHHHDPPGSKESAFKHYFFEFLMLFLAVSAGFFVENQREHFIEHKRAREFAASLFSDLQTDTAGTRRFLRYYSLATNQVDTLLQLLKESDPENIPSGKLYWYGLFGGAYSHFVPNNATFEQMKGSGSLRYFSNQKLASEVAQYDQVCRKLVWDQERDRSIYAEVRKLRSRIFDFRYNEVANDLYQESTGKPMWYAIDSFMKSNPPLFSTDKLLFNEYVEMVRSRFLLRTVTYADSVLTNADRLIALLKKEYHLDQP